MLAWLDGQLLESPEEPAIGVLDHGLVVGDGVFETIKIEGGSPFALTRHLDRLVRSAEGLGIGKPDVPAIREGIAATMEGQDISFGRIRVTVTSGPGMLGSPEEPAVLVRAPRSWLDERGADSRSVPTPVGSRCAGRRLRRSRSLGGRRLDVDLVGLRGVAAEDRRCGSCGRASPPAPAGRRGRPRARTAGCRAPCPRSVNSKRRSATISGCGEPYQRLSVPHATRFGPTQVMSLPSRWAAWSGSCMHVAPHRSELGPHVG